ncbi:MAG: ExeA family protein, partial [Desulfobaccales bacterium]
MNYNSFFGFSESPFLEAPDLKFFFPAKQHEIILAKLTDFIEARQGVAVVSGEDGVGKTMLALALVQKRPPSCHPLVLSRPEAEPLAISLMIGQVLGVDLRQRNVVNLTRLEEVLRAADQHGDSFLLLLDDAHLLTDQHLEEVYILSQIEDRGRQLLPIILMGRKGLRHKVASKANQRLFALIQHNLELTGLPFEETTPYIDHRLQQVGSSYQACFADGCSGQIFARTGGLPRRINQVCDQALTRAWQENRSRVTRDLLGGEESTPAYKPLTPPSQWRFPQNFFVLGIAALMLSGLGYVGYRYYLQSIPQVPTQVAELPSLPQKTPVPSPQGTAPRESALPPQAHPAARDKGLAELATPAPAPPPLSPEAASGREGGKPGPQPPSTPPSQASETQPAESKIHQVSAADGGLLRIAAAHYPSDRETGYDAIILANSEIENENIIYVGQFLVMPQIDS